MFLFAGFVNISLCLRLQDYIDKVECSGLLFLYVVPLAAYETRCCPLRGVWVLSLQSSRMRWTECREYSVPNNGA
jgi:hypothetical protein